MGAPKEIAAAEFEKTAREVLEHLPPEGVVVTRDGQPIARLVPMARRAPVHLIGSMKDEIEIYGDVFSTGIKWDAEGDAEP